MEVGDDGAAGDARAAMQVAEAAEARLARLTPREQDIVLPLVQGFSNREIAEQLGVSVKTVDLYRSRVMKRMEADSLPALVGMLIGVGRIDPFSLQVLQAVSPGA